MNLRHQSLGNYNPLESWEAPWNHMTYFWSNDPEPTNANQIGTISPQEISHSPQTSKACQCRVIETVMPPQRKEQQSICKREIEPMKPVPWRNVYHPRYPPNDRVCGKLNKRSKNDSNEVGDKGSLMKVKPRSISLPNRRKPLTMIPIICKDHIPQDHEIQIENKSGPHSTKKCGPPILPLCGCNYNFDGTTNYKFENDLNRNNRRVVHFEKPLLPRKEIDVKTTNHGVNNVNQVSCIDKKISNHIFRKNSYPSTYTPKRKQVCRCIPPFKISEPIKPARRVVFGRQHTRQWNKSYSRNAGKNTHFGCDICTSGVAPETTPKSILRRIRKTPNTVRTTAEYLQRRKDEVANDVRERIFQDIREAATKMEPSKECREKLLLPTDYCIFCNQPLSPFGVCNECLPPTPSSKPLSLPVLKDKEWITSNCRDNTLNESSDVYDLMSLENYVKQLGTKFSPHQNSSSPMTNSNLQKNQSLMTQRPSVKLPEGDCSHAIPQQFQNEQTSNHNSFPNVVPMSVPWHEYCQQHYSTQHCACPNYACNSWTTFHHPSDCPFHFSPTQYGSYNLHQGAFPSGTPMKGFSYPNQTPNMSQRFTNINQQIPNMSQQTPNMSQQTPNMSQQTPNMSQQTPNMSQQTPNMSQQTPNMSQHFPSMSQNFPNVSQQIASMNRQNVPHQNCPQGAISGSPPAISRGSLVTFAATLNVGNVNPQDISVVMYANRVLVAEAVNRSHNGSGESVISQSWTLPPEVDIETLRCYMDNDILWIVAFPLPPSIPWRFGQVPAALGAPKFLNMPCPFEP